MMVVWFSVVGVGVSTMMVWCGGVVVVVWSVWWCSCNDNGMM